MKKLFSLICLIVTAHLGAANRSQNNANAARGTSAHPATVCAIGLCVLNALRTPETQKKEINSLKVKITAKEDAGTSSIFETPLLPSTFNEWTLQQPEDLEIYIKRPIWWFGETYVPKKKDVFCLLHIARSTLVGEQKSLRYRFFTFPSKPSVIIVGNGGDENTLKAENSSGEAVQLVGSPSLHYHTNDKSVRKITLKNPNGYEQSFVIHNPEKLNLFEIDRNKTLLAYNQK